MCNLTYFTDIDVLWFVVKIIAEPMLHFKTNKECCPQCQTKLKVHHTDTRKVYMLDIGKCKAHRTFMFCPDCKGVYPPEGFEKSVPPYSNVGYDVMVLTGRLI
ncbi:unnamed protein product, partial [marine sediment metagenome]